jgi:hypothetical protein
MDPRESVIVIRKGVEGGTLPPWAEDSAQGLRLVTPQGEDLMQVVRVPSPVVGPPASFFENPDIPYGGTYTRSSYDPGVAFITTGPRGPRDYRRVTPQQWAQNVAGDLYSY